LFQLQSFCHFSTFLANSKKYPNGIIWQSGGQTLKWYWVFKMVLQQRLYDNPAGNWQQSQITDDNRMSDERLGDNPKWNARGHPI
jgi:hypothetical protein